MLDSRAYSLRAAERATFTAFVLALDSGQTPRESFAAALSAWQKFRRDDGDVEARKNVVAIVLAVLGLDKADRWLLPA